MRSREGVTDEGGVSFAESRLTDEVLGVRSEEYLASARQGADEMARRPVGLSRRRCDAGGCHPPARARLLGLGPGQTRTPTTHAAAAIRAATSSTPTDKRDAPDGVHGRGPGPPLVAPLHEFGEIDPSTKPTSNPATGMTKKPTTPRDGVRPVSVR